MKAVSLTIHKLWQMSEVFFVEKQTDIQGKYYMPLIYRYRGIKIPIKLWKDIYFFLKNKCKIHLHNVEVF